MNNIFTDGRIVYLFSRGKDKELQVKRISDFYPYFYIGDEDGNSKSIFGKKAKKITVNTPYDVAKKRDYYKKTFEADVHYPNRFLIDYYSKKEIPDDPLRLHFIDIEVDAEFVPSVREARFPVSAITVWDSFNEKYYQFCCKDVDSTDVIVSQDTEILLCENESQMFDYFIEFEKQNFPDMLLAWGGDNFDFPYLFNRFGDERIKEISPLHNAGFDGNKYYIAGCSLMDMYHMYRHITQSSGQKESYQLGNIGAEELGLKKMFTDEDMSVILKDRNKLLPYNKRDVEIMVALDKKLKIVEYFNTIRRVSRSLFSDVFMNSRVIDNLLLWFSHNKYVLPTKQKNVKKDFEGAFVKSPPKGLHKWVADFDATALYPSIIITLNISPETHTPQGGININGVKFKKEPRGIYPELCLYLMQERAKFKKEMLKHSVGSKLYNVYDMLQKSLKFLINSIYGFSGYPGSRFYSDDLAGAITCAGRDFANWVGECAEKYGYKFLYADTDSCWISLNGNSLEECIVEGERFQNDVNENLIHFVKRYGNIENHCLELKFEKIFKHLFFGGKKRYVGDLVWQEGGEVQLDDPVFIGFEARRSDMPKIGRIFQKEFFRRILQEKTKEEVDEFINKYIDVIKQAEPVDLGFPVGIRNENEYKKIPIHMRAVKHSRKYNIDTFLPGEKIKYIFVDKVPRGREFTNVVAFKDKFPGGYQINYSRVIERIIWMKVRPVYELLGWSTGYGSKRSKIKVRPL